MKRAALIALPLAVIAGRSSHSDPLAKTSTSTTTAAVATGSTPTSDSPSVELLQRRDALTQYGVDCTAWQSPSTVEISGSDETGQCGDKVVIIHKDVSSDQNIYLGVRAAVRRIAERGGAQRPIIQNKGDWWYISTSEDDADRVAATGARELP